MHINNHPILGERLHDPVTIYFNGNPLRAYKKQTVAAALIANGVKKFGESRKLMQARGLFCSRGRCCSCYMTVNGEDHVRTCMKMVEDKMEIFPNMGDPDVRRDSHGN
ncbi:(2Fe-2S)-binding protein [Heyndrickxia oleronia]|uniref:(2Fe-2S)-binding protein n=1 Tax=Heyndrickxia oleronia TaxID=38875 RepID=UPI001C0ECC43|nr:(2Fe-2S)-binding protein [Heyndrickxia oleronia]MBU5211604.1 (2Fe-2S)-binding protein [Heyndrickxia oleronia]MCM3455033.1 (2Fe-2S)-binding protein [Heyndrickxia oleronia]